MGVIQVIKTWAGWLVLSMLIVQVFATGMQLLLKVILNKGSFIFALLTYRHMVAAFCVAPFAFLLDRGNSWKLTWSVFFWLFINALTGLTGAISLYYYGIRDTSATYAVNLLNLIPTVTFILSIIGRIEKLRIDTIEGKFKILGGILCVAGALTVSLYKGSELIHFSHRRLDHNSSTTNQLSKHNWARGTFMLVGSVLCYAIWYIVQVKVQKVFPFKYAAIMHTCIITSLQSLVIGLCIDTSKASWKLEWNLQLITIIYSGALNTAATYFLITRVVAKRGPTYPPMFSPLALIFTAIFESLLFGEPITLGSLVGSTVIMVGLYAFLWAKAQEYKKSQSERNAQVEAERRRRGESSTRIQSTAAANPTTSPGDT